MIYSKKKKKDHGTLKSVILSCNNFSLWFYYMSDQINAGFVSLRYFFQKNLLKILPNSKMWTVYVQFVHCHKSHKYTL